MSFPFPKAFAHRGASRDFPENTLLSMQKARQMGANWVEFDVNVTKDNVPILFHDETLKRVAGQNTPISSLTFEEVKEVDVGSYFNPLYSEQTIPTLQQMLQLAKNLKLNLNLELKPTIGREQDTVLQTLKDIAISHFDPNLTILFSSFSMPTLALLRQYSPYCTLGLLFHRWDKAWECYVDELDPVSIHLNVNIVTEKRIREIKKRHLKIAVYTVNSKAKAMRLFLQGVDAIFTDNATLCRDLNHAGQ